MITRQKWQMKCVVCIGRSNKKKTKVGIRHTLDFDKIYDPFKRLIR